MDKWIIPVLFLLLPFMLITPGLIWKAQQLFFILLPLFVVACLLKNIWVKIFLLYVGVWQIAILFHYFGNPKGPGPGSGLSIILGLMAAGLIFKVVSESKLPNEKWYMVIRIAVIGQIILALFQSFHVNLVAKFYGQFFVIKETLPDHLVGSLGNRNYLAAFVAYSLPMFIGWKRGAVLPFIAFIFVVCPSPATLAGAIGAAFYYAYSKDASPKRIIAYISIAVAVGAGFTVAYVLTTGNHLRDFTDLPAQLSQFLSTGRVDFDVFQGDLGRFGMWIMALGHLISTPFGMILGFGPGAYWGRDYSLHNEYMAVWFYFGLVGLFMLFAYIRQTWKHLWKSKNLVLMTSFLIMALEMVANHSFEIASTGMLGVIILGLIERERLNG